jgi:hypothetical protein
VEGRRGAGIAGKQRATRPSLRQHAGWPAHRDFGKQEPADADPEPQSQAWYGKIFGAKASVRNNAPVADIPGVQLRFNKADTAQAPTKGRVLDHIGFDVKDLKAFVKFLEANNVKLDRPYSINESGIGIAFITDPWGSYIEINERPPQ